MRRINLKSGISKRFAKLIAPALLLTLVSLSANAQDQGLPCDGTDIDLQCPIDGGVVVLMAAGAFLGFKKLAAK